VKSVQKEVCDGRRESDHVWRFADLPGEAQPGNPDESLQGPGRKQTSQGI
jgi:hypothetical protein